ncbi:nuclear transport factor 2 family protein [Solihabitans fulvus]|uniref:Nuclear transport factor 2 family protein n=1 Tax=Solihabitans fulvus TaxID=1892852 RepID=A0A5B2WNB2_9PSEU|nr:nuclear transport factor 2 family protein [Solihabitans fulvus]
MASPCRRTGPTAVRRARAPADRVYHAFNRRDLAVLRQVWSADPLAQLNNPLGGLLRGGDAIAELYARVFDGPARVMVTFGDIVEYADDTHAVFAGRETGTFTGRDGAELPLAIRTSRYFRYDPAAGRRAMLHHHGSIDDPVALRAYQDAVAG